MRLQRLIQMRKKRVERKVEKMRKPEVALALHALI